MKKLFCCIDRNISYVTYKLKEISKLLVLLILLLSAFTAFIPVGISVLEKDLIDSLSMVNEINYNQLLLMIGMLCFLTFLSPACDAGIRFLLRYKGILIQKNHMKETVKHMSDLKMEHLENPKTQFLLELSCDESNIDPLKVMDPVRKIFTLLLTTISYVIILLRLHLVAAGVPFLLAIPFAYLGRKRELSEFLSKYDDSILDLNRRIDYYSKVVKEPMYAKENIIYNVGDFFNHKRKQCKEQVMKKQMVYLKKELILSFVIALIALFAQYGMYLYLGEISLLGQITIGQITLYFNAFTAVLFSMTAMVDSLTYIDGHIMLEDYKREFFQLSTEEDVMESEEVVTGVGHRITFSHVSFHYPNSDRDIVRDLTFTIEADDVTAFIGENGCGKSTLIKLLTRQYTPQEGNILIDDIDINKYSKNQLTQLLGVMFQEIAHITVPIREYIAMSKDEMDERRLRESIELAECTKIIEHSTNGLDTVMGYTFSTENAREFSGGEWQKMAIARLLYHNPDIYILDEPTAALDALAEYHFFESVKQLVSHHTIIMVSHRLSIAKLCTKIVYFQKDRVYVDTHENLLHTVPEYKELYELQRKMYLVED